MRTLDRVQVAIEIEAGEGTIRGRFAVEGLPESEFFGWLELLDLLFRASDGRPIRAQGRTRDRAG
jgi:hypothetical protein